MTWLARLQASLMTGRAATVPVLTLLALLAISPAGPARAQVELDLRDADLRSFVTIVADATAPRR